MDQSSVPLFDVNPSGRSRKAKPPKPPSDTDQTFHYYRDAYRARAGQDLILPSGAAWGRIKHECKRLVSLIPDRELREAFLDVFFATRDLYVIDRGYPLRLALWDQTFQKLLKEASRMTAERRRAGGAVSDTTPTVPRPLGRQWCVEVQTSEGGTIAADTVHAVDVAGAERVGRRKMARALASDLTAQLKIYEVGRG